MARIEIDPNYSSPTFSRATAATDLFKKEDVQALAAAISTHVHDGAGKGLLVSGPVNGSQVVDGTITSAKIADGTIATADLANASVTPAKMGTAAAVKAYRSTNQSIPDTVLTAVSFDSESFDGDTMHDTAVNPGRITIKTAGKYRLTAQVRWGISAAGYRFATIRDSTTSNVGEDGRASAGAAIWTHNAVVAIVSAAVNDWFDVAVQHNSGGALNVEGGIGQLWFAAERIGP